MTPGQLLDAPAQLLLVNRRHRYGPTLSVAVLSRLPAGSALGHPESILQNTDCSATSLRGQKFPAANSNACAWRAEHRFVQLYIRKKALEADIHLLQLLEALGLVCFHPSVQLLPAVIGRGRHLQAQQTSATLWPWLSNCSAVRSLRMICTGVWRLRFMGLLLAKSGLL